MGIQRAVGAKSAPNQKDDALSQVSSSFTTSSGPADRSPISLPLASKIFTWGKEKWPGERYLVHAGLSKSTTLIRRTAKRPGCFAARSRSFASRSWQGSHHGAKKSKTVIFPETG